MGPALGFLVGPPHAGGGDLLRGLAPQASDLVGYAPYVDRVARNPRQQRHASDNTEEAQRAECALDLALRGRQVVVVSSGDPGVFAMASVVLEAAAGHDRCIIPVRPENVDAWLNPDPSNLAAQYAILDDRDRPYYEHRLAA